jgi:hypothetical protein
MATNSGTMPKKVTRYPLVWPPFWKRVAADNRQSRGFREAALTTRRHYNSTLQKTEDVTVPGTKPVTMATARQRLSDQLDRLGADDVVLSTNVELTAYGEPRGGRVTPTDPGAAVYFTLATKDRVLACDSWKTVEQNIAAIAAHIECIRRIDRYGVGTLEQAFAGYDALPPPSEENRPAWRKILRFPPLTQVTKDDVQVAFRTLARAAATDEARLLELNLARDQALAELGR